MAFREAAPPGFRSEHLATALIAPSQVANQRDDL
jgi:hypothetical protein